MLNFQELADLISLTCYFIIAGFSIMIVPTIIFLIVRTIIFIKRRLRRTPRATVHDIEEINDNIDELREDVNDYWVNLNQRVRVLEENDELEQLKELKRKKNVTKRA